MPYIGTIIHAWLTLWATPSGKTVDTTMDLSSASWTVKPKPCPWLNRLIFTELKVSSGFGIGPWVKLPAKINTNVIIRYLIMFSSQRSLTRSGVCDDGRLHEELCLNVGCLRLWSSALKEIGVSRLTSSSIEPLLSSISFIIAEMSSVVFPLTASPFISNTASLTFKRPSCLEKKMQSYGDSSRLGVQALLYHICDPFWLDFFNNQLLWIIKFESKSKAFGLITLETYWY